jgi:hypothetical protein
MNKVLGNLKKRQTISAGKGAFTLGLSLHAQAIFVKMLTCCCSRQTALPKHQSTTQTIPPIPLLRAVWYELTPSITGWVGTPQMLMRGYRNNSACPWEVRRYVKRSPVPSRLLSVTLGRGETDDRLLCA